MTYVATNGNTAAAPASEFPAPPRSLHVINEKKDVPPKIARGPAIAGLSIEA